MTDYTKATRKTVVADLTIIQTRPGDPMHVLVAHGEENADVWAAFLKTRSGMLPERTEVYYLSSQEEADAFAAKFPVGSEIEPMTHWVEVGEQFLNFVRDCIDRMDAPAVNGGDGMTPLAFEVLDEAGLTSFRTGVSSLVLDSLGHQRVERLKTFFGDNWEAAAVFEYCWLNLPASSPAYIAALYRFHFYISGDDFAAGYLWRDLEMLVHGVEAAAINTFEMRKKAGAAGSQKSAEARAARRSALVDEMEAVAQRNPDVMSLGIEAVARLAIESCARKAPVQWKQGRGQMADYLGEIRRGEAGLELQHRFNTLFGAKPPKQFP